MARNSVNVTRNRPTAVLVIAVLHFVFGGLGLIGTVCGGATLFLLPLLPSPPPPPGQPRVPTYMDFMEAMAEKAPGFTLITYGGMALGLVFAVLMIVAGFDLLRMNQRGRTLSIVYAALSILTTLLTFVYNLLFTMPILPELLDQMMPAAAPMNPQQQQNFQNFMRFIFNISYYAGLLAPFFQMIYPAAVLIVMYRPSVRAAFREAPAPAPVELLPEATDQFEERER